ncbi:glycosyltransferase [candidate division WOR-3 bacterium]|nr:glycosyltransferase [candidate division WOR-3 bacterium]
MPKKNKILYIINNLLIGGAEKLLLSVIDKLNKDKYDIMVCCLYSNNPLKSEFEKRGVTVKSLGIKNNRDILCIFKLVKLLKQERANIVHTHLFYANIYGRIAAKLVRVPIIISTEHSNAPWRNKQRLKLKIRLLIDRVTAKFCDRIIAISESVKDNLIQWERIDPNKIVVIHNGINIKKYQIMDKNRDGSSSDSVIGCIGRLEPIKGHIFFMKAAARIFEKIRNVRFILIGDGSLRQDLEKLAQDLNISKRVSFLGFRDDIPELLSVIDVFVLPSLWEGFGIVLLEAMAMGKVVVASDVGGISEIVVDKKTGYLCPPMDPNTLADIVVGLLKDPLKIRTMGLVGRERVKKHFTLDKMVEKTEHVYNTLIIEKLVS